MPENFLTRANPTTRARLLLPAVGRRWKEFERLVVEVDSASLWWTGRVVEPFTVLQARPFATEMAPRSAGMFGLHGVAAVGLDDVELKPFPSKPSLTSTSRDAAWPLVHMGRA